MLPHIGIQHLAFEHGAIMENFLRPFGGTTMSEKIRKFCQEFNVPQKDRKTMDDIWFNRNRVNHQDFHKGWRSVNYFHVRIKVFFIF